uniref:Uncharacterized protein n=1 Tax=Eubacterium cellulosolvens (strain ATCC 43171 / JCM 9499 / 6) TaxID=633697 RepID=I5AQK2_EUBC6
MAVALMCGSFLNERNLDFVQISYCKNWKIIVENLNKLTYNRNWLKIRGV